VDVITQYKQTKSKFGKLIGMKMPELALEIPTLHTLGKICLISYKLINFTLMNITRYYFFKQRLLLAPSTQKNCLINDDEICSG